MNTSRFYQKLKYENIISTDVKNAILNALAYDTLRDTKQF